MTSVVDPVSTTDWILQVAVKLTWRYITPAGETILADGPAGEGDATSQTIPLHARWMRWRLADGPAHGERRTD